MVQGVLLWNAKCGSGMWRVPVSDFFGGFIVGGFTPVSPPPSISTFIASLPLGLAIVACGAVSGAMLRAASAVGAMRGAPSPHLPRTGRTRGPGPLYLRAMGFELILTCCVATCRNFRVCHAVTTVAFGDAMVRVMHLRVSDPEFRPLSNPWLGALASAAAYLPADGGGGLGVGGGGEGAWGVLVRSDSGVATAGAGLVLVSAAAYLFRFSSLVAQISGCLSLPHNPFVLSPEKYDITADDKKAR